MASISPSTLDAQLKVLDQQLSQTDQSITQLATKPVSHPWWTTTNAMTMSSVTLVFGMVVFVLATYLIRHGTPTDSVLKIFGTTLIIVSAIFLVIAGYDDKQIAPVMGLLGTIAGYLLGKDTRPAP